MKKIIIIIGILLLSLNMSACNKGAVSIKGMNVDSADKSVADWANTIEKDGIYLAKGGDSTNGNEYYIFIKNQNTDNVNAKLDKTKGLIINVATKEKNNKSTQIVELNISNTKADHIILNGKEVKQTDIKSLK